MIVLRLRSPQQCCSHTQLEERADTQCVIPLTQVNVSTDPNKIKDITEGDSMIVDFTYSVKWKETTIPFEKRMVKYSQYSFLPQHLEVRHRLTPRSTAKEYWLRLSSCAHRLSMQQHTRENACVLVHASQSPNICRCRHGWSMC